MNGFGSTKFNVDLLLLTFLFIFLVPIACTWNMHVQAHIKYVLTSAPRAQFHCDLGKQMVFDTVALYS